MQADTQSTGAVLLAAFVSGLFRDNLKRSETSDVLLVSAVREGKQQQLRIAFRGIYANVRSLLNIA